MRIKIYKLNYSFNLFIYLISIRAVDGKIALIGVLAALGVVLLLILICVCKCFCCQGKRKSKGAKLSEFRKAEKERLLGGKNLYIDII